MAEMGGSLAAERRVAVFVHAGKLIPHAVVDGQLQLRMAGYERDLVPTLSIPLFPASTESRLQEG